MFRQVSSNIVHQTLTLLKSTKPKLTTVSGVLSRNMSTSTGSGLDLNLTGVFPPIATPFNSDESIAYDKLKENLDKWNQVPLRGYVVQGSNGEYAFLTPSERVELVQKVCQMVPKDKMILAGSGCESTSATIEMTQNMAKAGAHAALVVTPCYYKNRMTNQALEQHYQKVADNSSIPIILYSVPANTGIDLAPEVILKLAGHPNIIGLKESGGDIAKIGNIVYKTQNQSFQVLAGSASFLYPALAVGAVGGVCALANMLGSQCCELQRLYEAGKHSEARDLQQRLIAPNGGVTKQFGVPGLKTAMEWFGYHGGPLRSPLIPLSPDEVSVLRETFIGSGFIER